VDVINADTLHFKGYTSAVTSVAQKFNIA